MKKILLWLTLLSFSTLVHAGSNIKTIHPKIGSIQASFSELAKTKLAKVYEINLPIAGRLHRIPLIPNTKVKKGQIIASLDQYPLEQDVAEASANLKVLNLSYLNAERKLKRQQSLGSQGFVSKSNLDDLITKKQVAYAQVKKAAANLALAKYRLEQSSIASPINGIVLKRYTEGGMWQEAGLPLLRIGSLSDLEVESEVLSQDAQKLKIGDRVLLTSSANPLAITGHVKRIDLAGFTKPSSLGVDEQRVWVIIGVDHLNHSRLGVGYRLQAEFLVGSAKKGVLLVPRFSVLQDANGRLYVFKVVDKKLVKQVVQVGTVTDTQMEIVKGLTKTDLIVAAPSAQMIAGEKI